MKSTQRGYGLGPSCLGALSRARLLVAFQELGGIGPAGVPAGGNATPCLWSGQEKPDHRQQSQET